ncbi:acetyl-CoA carboxylase biotin carboxyl carrier protein [Barrientosiimonas marina]|uniref:Biotin carboxyl carrier protein of acetyl-CoA carboxylase n=1 Tax=Lentibacillus kimchii TaxID=1542911 RepID=A0ABW2V010_9BACI
MLKVEELRELVKIVDQSTIDEFTYETDGTTVTMKKTNAQMPPAVNVSPASTTSESQAPVSAAEPEVKAAPATSSSQTDQAHAETQTAADFDYEIVSPMVGTFYTKPEPESDAYVKKGTKVANDSTVCIVEAMKLFNEIEAEVSGEITEILVDDGELVEYGQPLFRVKTK